MASFNWTYFSFYQYDTMWIYRELLAIPILVLILWYGWMKVVRSALVDAQAMAMEEANAMLKAGQMSDESAESGIDEADGDGFVMMPPSAGTRAKTKSDLNKFRDDDDTPAWPPQMATRKQDLNTPLTPSLGLGGLKQKATSPLNEESKKDI